MPSWKKVIISGSAAELASLYAPSITGSLQGTASWAQNAVSASYAATSSFSLATTENRILVLNQSGYTITKGMVVHISASGNASDIPRVVSASYESDLYSANTLGLSSQDMTTGDQGYVTTEGVLTGIDTSNYISGQLVFLGAAGAITGAAPQAPLHSVRLGQIVRDQSVNGSIYVRIDNGYELGELHDTVDATTTTSYGDLLIKSGSVWTNSRQLTGSYGLTGSFQATSFTGSLFGTASYDPTIIRLSGSSIYSLIDPIVSNFSTDGGVYIGSGSGNNSVDAFASVFIGRWAGQNAVATNQAVAIGQYAGAFTSGSLNSVFIGLEAGSASISSSYSNFIGNDAGASSNDTIYSNFLGSGAGQGSIGLYRSNVMGIFAGLNSSGSYRSNWLGQQAGQSTIASYDSNFLGYAAGYEVSSSYRSNFIGFFNGYRTSGSHNSNFIGNSTGRDSKNAAESIFMGTDTGRLSTASSASVYIGQQAGYQVNNSSRSVFIGPAAGYATSQSYSCNFIGDNAGLRATGSYYSNFIGYWTGRLASGSYNSNFIGVQAGNESIALFESNLIGTSAGYQASGSSYVSYIGYQAGVRAYYSGDSVFIGKTAGYEVMNASQSVYIGEVAGANQSGSGNSVFIGLAAGRYAGNTYYTNALGYTAGYLATGSIYSNFLGYAAGRNTVNATYSNLIGYRAGYAITTNSIGSNNIIIGTNITLASGSKDSINIGGIIFGTGSYSTVSGNPSSGSVSGGRIGIGIVSPTATLHVNNTSATDNSFLVEDSTNPDTTPFIIDTEGNVGIGTTTPTNKLEVNGSFRLTGTGSAIFQSWDYGTEMNISNISSIGGWARAHKITTSDTTGTVFFGAVGGDTTLTRAYWTIGTPSPTEVGQNLTKGVHLLKNGFVGIGTTIPSASLHITNTSTSASFLVEDSTNPDATPFIIDSAGNVGIGTTTPTAKLYVSGNAGAVNWVGTDHIYQQFYPSGLSAGRFGYIGFPASGSRSLRIYNETVEGDISLGTNSTTRLYISASGNVGIGTTAPTKIFEVVSGSNSAYFDLTATAGPLAAVATSDFTKLARFNASDGTNSISVGLRSSAETANPGFGEQNDTYIYANSNANGLNIINAAGTGTADYIKFFAGKVATETPSMIIIGSGSSKGNVGIGTTTPTAKLEVIGDFKFGPWGVRALTFGTYQYGTDFDMSPYNTGGWARAHRIKTSDPSGSIFFGAHGTNTGLIKSFWTIDAPESNTFFSTTNGISLLKSGNVGIGTITPTAKLHVNNTGSDNSFLIEDSTNPDSTPFVIDNSGSVGIGMTTPTPSTKLDILYTGSDTGVLIRGGSSVSNSIPLSLWDTGTGANNRNIILFGHSNLYVTGSRIYSTNPSPNATTGAKLVFETTSDDIGTFNTSQLVLSNNGNVGIGTDTPTYTLQIQAAPTASIRLQETGSGGNKRLDLTIDASGVARISANQSAQQIAFDTVGNERIRITNNGNVGIGTTTPIASLHTTGSAIISGSLTVGLGSIGSSENTLILGVPPAGGTGEGGQLLLSAAGGTYTTASMIDNYQNKLRFLRGTNAGSDAYKLQLDMHTGQMQLPNYNSSTAFSGTAAGYLAFDSSGNIFTVGGVTATPGGSTTQVQFNNGGALAGTPIMTIVDPTVQISGSVGVTGSLTATNAVIAQANGAMYFRGGDDAELWDINVANTVGIYGQQDATVGSVKLGSGGGTISGWSSSIGIGTVLPNSGTLHVNGNVFATSFTGSFTGSLIGELTGTASFATTASFAEKSTLSDIASAVYVQNTVGTGTYFLTMVDSQNTLSADAELVNTQDLSYNGFTGTLSFFGGNGTVNATATRAISSSYATSASLSVDTINKSVYTVGILSGSASWGQSGDGTITLPAVNAVLYDNAIHSGSAKIYAIAGGTSGTGGLSALVNNDTNYILIDYNSGNPTYSISTADTSNDSNIALAYIVYRLNNFVHVLDFGDQGSGLPNKINRRLEKTQRFARESGLNLSLSGSTGIAIIDSGVAWNGTNRQTIDIVNSSGSIFFKNYHSGGVWTTSTTGDYINNSYYDNGTDLTAVSSGKYLTNWYYRGQEINGHIYEVISSNQYDTVALAQLATEPSLPELVSSHAVLVGRIIVQSGSYDGIVESAFTSVFQATQVTAHNDLTAKQGGASNEYYHLSANQYNNIALTNTTNIFTADQVISGSLTVTGSYNSPSGNTIDSNALIQASLLYLSNNF